LREGPDRSLAKDVTKNGDTYGGFRCVKTEGLWAQGWNRAEADGMQLASG